ncbi:MAG TPA: DUF6152 family protein [Caulobacteraceae bacterium]
MKISGKGRIGVALAAAAGLATAAPALAHHSFAMYDNDHQLKLTGTVSHFQWTNPHVYIELENGDAGAKVKHWTIECANPGILDRVGWKFNMIKVGDKLTVVIAPLRTGEPGALLKQVTLPDGRVFTNGAPAGKALIQ